MFVTIYGKAFGLGVRVGRKATKKNKKIKGFKVFKTKIKLFFLFCDAN